MVFVFFLCLKVEVFDEDNTSDKLIGAAQLSLNDFQVLAEFLNMFFIRIVKP
jgi:hypothetical protein